MLLNERGVMRLNEHGGSVSESEAADLFNRLFTSVKSYGTFPLSTFAFPWENDEIMLRITFTPLGISMLIDNLNVSSSPGADAISPKLFKIANGIVSVLPSAVSQQCLIIHRSI